MLRFEREPLLAHEPSQPRNTDLTWRYSRNDSSKLVPHPRTRGETSDAQVADDERREREGKRRRRETDYVDWLQAEALTNSCHLD